MAPLTLLGVYALLAVITALWIAYLRVFSWLGTVIGGVLWPLTWIYAGFVALIAMGDR